MAVAAIRFARRPRNLAALTLGAVGAGLTASEASAGRGWCRTDPIFSIDGHLTDVMVGAPLVRALLTVTGPNEIVVTVPKRITAGLVLPGPGFLRGDRYTIRHSRKLRRTGKGVQVEISVRVPSRDDKMAVTLVVRPRLILDLLRPKRAEGTANEWITVEAVV